MKYIININKINIQRTLPAIETRATTMNIFALSDATVEGGVK